MDKTENTLDAATAERTSGMNTRSRPWEIAADLEAAAKAVREAELALDAIHPSALPEVEAIEGTEWVNCHMAKALQALSDKYQAIADAEPEL